MHFAPLPTRQSCSSADTTAQSCEGTHSGLKTNQTAVQQETSATATGCFAPGAETLSWTNITWTHQEAASGCRAGAQVYSRALQKVLCCRLVEVSKSAWFNDSFVHSKELASVLPVLHSSVWNPHAIPHAWPHIATFSPLDRVKWEIPLCSKGKTDRLKTFHSCNSVSVWKI